MCLKCFTKPILKTIILRPKRKRIQYYVESDSYISEVRKRPKKMQKRKIIYEVDIDGIPYEPDSPTEEEDLKLIIQKRNNQNK